MEGISVKDFEALCERLGEAGLFDKISDRDQRVEDFWAGEVVRLDVADRQFFVSIKVEER